MHKGLKWRRWKARKEKFCIFFWSTLFCWLHSLLISLGLSRCSTYFSASQFNSEVLLLLQFEKIIFFRRRIKPAFQSQQHWLFINDYNIFPKFSSPQILSRYSVKQFCNHFHWKWFKLKCVETDVDAMIIIINLLHLGGFISKSPI
jgi:hypothetical protein